MGALFASLRSDERDQCLSSYRTVYISQRTSWVRFGTFKNSSNTGFVHSDQRRNVYHHCVCLIYGKNQSILKPRIFIIMTEAADDCMDVLLLQIRTILDGRRTPTSNLQSGMECWNEDLPLIRSRVSSPCLVVEEHTHSSKRDLVAQRNSHGSVPVWEQQAPINTMTLPDIFEMLSPEDMNCIVCVRRIHRLGFKSVRYLRRFFSRFGQIRKIILLPSRPKEWLLGPDMAIRPSSMCFIVFDCRESASGILLQETYQVGSCQVNVSPYSPDNSYLGDKHSRCQSRTSSMSSMETCSSP